MIAIIIYILLLALLTIFTIHVIIKTNSWPKIFILLVLIQIVFFGLSSYLH